jgi:outer membrane immunogenic protein
MGDTMKLLKIALVSSVFVLGASAANAADLYKGGSLKDAPEYMPPISWSGFYFGVNAGVGFDDNEYCVLKEIPVSAEPDNGGDEQRLVESTRKECEDGDNIFLGGLHAGYNWQKDGALLLGIEGDISFGDDIDYLASIRGRLGLALDQLLIYGTGGVAFMGVDDAFNDSDTLTGWVAGLGAEYKLSANLSAGVEGLYYSFDEDSAYSDDNFDFWVVRGRLTYHLDSGYSDPLK